MNIHLHIEGSRFLSQIFLVIEINVAIREPTWLPNNEYLRYYQNYLCAYEHNMDAYVYKILSLYWKYFETDWHKVKKNNYDYQMKHIQDIIQIISVYMQSIYMHMCVKFELSIRNASRVIDINVSKKNNYGCQVEND